MKQKKEIQYDLALSSYAATPEHAIEFLYKEAERVGGSTLTDVKLMLKHDPLSGYGYAGYAKTQATVEIDVDEKFIDEPPF